jgi:uncharacterized protein (DUF4415 family)
MSEKQVISAINAAFSASKQKTSPYDAVAAVTRVEDGTAWVSLTPGTETPASMGIACEAGDSVNVRVSGGRAYVVGNTTAPPTDDAQAIAAKAAAIVAEGKAAIAKSDASEAKSTAKAAKSDAAEAKGTAAESKEAADKALVETKDLVTLRIDSSRGTVFKNSEVSTVLTVRCYKRGQEITTQAALRDAMGDQTARIRWWVLRMGDTDWVSLDDGDEKLSGDGFRLTLDPDDVDVKCTFKAEVVTD